MFLKTIPIHGNCREFVFNWKVPDKNHLWNEIHVFYPAPEA